MKRHLWRTVGRTAIVAAVGLLALLGSPQAAQTDDDCTVKLTPNDDIQDAITEAQARAVTDPVICLEAGTWTENLTIERGVTIRGTGEEPSVIEGREENSNVIEVSASEPINVVLENLTVSGTSKEVGVGVTVVGQAEFTAHNITITENDGGGLFLSHEAPAELHDSTVSQNGFAGIALQQFSEKLTLGNSRVTKNRGRGILHLGSAQMEVRNSSVSRNDGAGISVAGPATTIRGSMVAENAGPGIRLRVSAQTEIRDSTISQNDHSGIQVRGSSEATIRDNAITNNSRGVVLVEAPCEDTDETFTGVLEGGANTFDDNEEGAVCPDELEFLMTEEGGELDRRE